MSHCPNRLLLKYNCETKPLLEDYLPNVFGGCDVRAAGSLEYGLSNSSNTVAVCAISGNEGHSSMTLRHTTPSWTLLDE